MFYNHIIVIKICWSIPVETIKENTFNTTFKACLEIRSNHIIYLNYKVNGTTGEGTSQSVRERKVIAEKWMEIKQTTNLHIMIQVGGAPLPDVLELVIFIYNFLR